ncbi:hypothetical protein D039_4478A, partial [Vibrio parahaemolyticus EKP-028]
MQSLRV